MAGTGVCHSRCNHICGVFPSSYTFVFFVCACLLAHPGYEANSGCVKTSTSTNISTYKRVGVGGCMGVGETHNVLRMQ